MSVPPAVADGPTASGGGARRRVAVVGAGVSGLTAAYLLQRKYDVTLFEADDRLGGHAHTHDVSTADGRLLGIDTGFIVHNERTYPHLLRLFGELGVATQPTEMSMSVRCEGCGLEYAGARGPAGLFAQRRNGADPRYLRMLVEVTRFHRQARRLLAAAEDTEVDGVTLGAFLALGGYSPYFVRHFMIPVVSAVWSSAADLALQYPARYLFAFLANHGMLSVSGSPSWRTVTGGSRTYVEKAATGLTAVLTRTPVRTVTRTGGGVSVRDDADTVHEVDAVVVATHPDQALRLLADPTEAERTVLGSFSYSTNETVFHTDSTILPKAPAARASWNYLMPACDMRGRREVTVSYWMNRLHDLVEPVGSAPVDYIVSLNAPERIDPATVLDRMTYQHPTYTPASVAAQADLPALNDGVTAFAGAYHGWGFHEDGCSSGVRAAASLGVAW